MTKIALNVIYISITFHQLRKTLNNMDKHWRAEVIFKSDFYQTLATDFV